MANVVHGCGRKTISGDRSWKQPDAKAFEQPLWGLPKNPSAHLQPIDRIVALIRLQGCPQTPDCGQAWNHHLKIVATASR
jgi:hypothetical protein